MKSYFGGLLCLSWSQDGRYIATGGEDDLITIFSFHENRVACRGRGHSSWINCVQFDNWAHSYNHINSSNSKDNDDQDSDFEDYHNKKTSSNNSNLNVRKRKESGSSSAAHKRMSSLSDYEQLFNSSKALFYRLGSVGQDNKIAFWDLTEDVLKEKIHSRSRVTSIVNSNQTEIFNRDHEQRNSMLTASGNYKINNRQMVNEENNNLLPSSTNSTTSSSSGGGLGFFKKNKRNTNSIKNSINKNINSNQVHNSSNINSGGSNSSKTLQQKFLNLNLNSMCPKLDEIPIIEPLICKRIAQERLTSLIFKEDSFLVACHDGTISTWMRPGKVSFN